MKKTGRKLPSNITAASKPNVKLRVEFETYERFGSGQIRKATVSGNTLLDALKKMVDNMQLYLESDMIEEENMTAEQVIEDIAGSNGDGCDFIFLLKNLTTGEVYIEEDYSEEDEDWD